MPRTTCASFLEEIHRAAPFLEELVRWDIIGAELRDGMLAVRIAHDLRMSPEAQRRLAANEPLSIRDKINIWLQAQVAVGGPKVFQPTLDQCLAMEQVAPRIAINDYAQPYPVMVIDLPEKYRQARACSFGSAAGVSTHAPACLLVGAHGSPPWTIWVGLVLDSGIGVQWALMPSDATIEDGIVREFGQDSYLPAGPADLRIPSGYRATRRGENHDRGLDDKRPRRNRLPPTAALATRALEDACVRVWPEPTQATIHQARLGEPAPPSRWGHSADQLPTIHVERADNRGESSEYIDGPGQPAP